MPGGTCSVALCKTNYMKCRRDGSQIRFFSFPSDPGIEKAWIETCGRETDFKTKSKRVCSLHFQMSDYEDEIQARLLNYPPKKLKKDAVPSLNVLQPAILEPSSAPTASERAKRYSKKLRKKVVDECLEQLKGGSKSIKKNSKGRVNVLIKSNNKIIDKNMKKAISPIKRKDRAQDNNIRKRGTVAIRETNKLPGKNMRKEESSLNQNKNKVCNINAEQVSVTIQNKNKVCDKILEKEDIIPIEERIVITDKNIEEKVSSPIPTDNNVIDENTKVLLVTVPIVTTILQNPIEDCVCGVSKNCFKCQLRILKEENEHLKSKIQIHVKNERDLRHTNDLAQKRFRALESQFESKVKTAFQDFLSPNQVMAVLKKKSKVRWTEEEISKAFNIMQFSKRFYIYLKNTLNYPLPSLSTIKKWAFDTSLKIEKDSSLDMSLDLPISCSESVPSDFLVQSDNLSLHHPMDYETLPLDNHTFSETLPSDHLAVSKNPIPVKEVSKESLNPAGIQIRTLYFPSDRNVDSVNPVNNKTSRIVDSVNPVNNKTSTVANKNFQFHLSHKNYFNKLILKRLRRKVTKPKRFACSICQKGFDLNGALKRHFKTHVLDNPWTCDVCDESFSSKYHLDRHITTHRNADKFVCDICDQSFVKKVNFQDHYLKHKNIQVQDLYNKNINVDQCIIEDASNEQYGADQFLVANDSTLVKAKPYMCHICNELFENKNDLKVHLVVCKSESRSSAKDGNRVKGAYVCEWCNKEFRYRQYFQDHLLRHENGKILCVAPQNGKIFVCEICDKTFSKTSTLCQHKILHDDNKNKVQFFCSICNKGFRQKRYLSQHLQTHSEEKPFACVLCPKRFAQNSTLKKHFETHKNESFANLTDFYA